MRKTAEALEQAVILFFYSIQVEKEPWGWRGQIPPSQERSAEPAEPPSLQAAPHFWFPAYPAPRGQGGWQRAWGCGGG